MKLAVLLMLVLLNVLAQPAMAQSTATPATPTAPEEYVPRRTSAEDVFKGASGELKTNDTRVGRTAMVAVVAGVSGLAILIVLAATRGRSVSPAIRPHNPTKLQRDLAKATGLSRQEFKRLTLLARRKQLSNPLVMLLCPSSLDREPAAAERR